MNKNNLFKIVIAVLLVISVINNIHLNNKIENVQQNLQNNINNIHSSINNISGNVQNTMNRFREENTWLRNAKYQIINFDIENEKATLEFDVVLNEIKKDEKVYAIIKQNEGQQEYKYELNRTEGLNYSATCELSSEYNYNIQLLAEGNDTYRSTQLFNINLKGYINDLYMIEIRPMNMRTSNNVTDYTLRLLVETINPRKFNLNLDAKQLSIEDLYVEVYNKDSLIKTYNVIKDGNKNEEIFSADIEEMEKRAVRERIQRGEFEGFEVYIKDEVKKKIEFEELNFKIYLTNNMGYTYEAVFNMKDHQMHKTVIKKD